MLGKRECNLLKPLSQLYLHMQATPSRQAYMVKPAATLWTAVRRWSGLRASVRGEQLLAATLWTGWCR